MHFRLQFFQPYDLPPLLQRPWYPSRVPAPRASSSPHPSLRRSTFSRRSPPRRLSSFDNRPFATPIYSTYPSFYADQVRPPLTVASLDPEQTADIPTASSESGRLAPTDVVHRNRACAAPPQLTAT